MLNCCYLDRSSWLFRSVVWPGFKHRMRAHSCCCEKMKDVIYTEDICQQIQQPEVGLRLHFLLRKLKAFKRLHQVKVSWCLERSYFLFFIRGHFVFCSVKPKFAIASLKIVNKRVVFGHKYVAQFLLERQVSKYYAVHAHFTTSNFKREEPAGKCVFIFIECLWLILDSFTSLTTQPWTIEGFTMHEESAL